MNKEKRLANIALVVFSVISFVFLLLPLGPIVKSARLVGGYIFLPFVESSASLARYVSGVSYNTVCLLNTEDENRSLRAKIKNAQLAEAQFDALSKENKRLSEMLQLSAAAKWEGVWANILEHDPAHWHSVLSVNRGLRDGVALRDAVIGIYGGKTGLVGKIVEVTRDASKILLITDEMSSVSCYVQDTQWEGLLQGSGRLALRLNYLPAEIAISTGSEVLTSPSSAVFPPGISVGSISKFYPRESFTNFVSAEVRPAVMPAALKEVFIIRSGRSKKHD